MENAKEKKISFKWTRRRILGFLGLGLGGAVILRRRVGSSAEKIAAESDEHRKIVAGSNSCKANISRKVADYWHALRRG